MFEGIYNFISNHKTIVARIAFNENKLKDEVIQRLKYTSEKFMKKPMYQDGNENEDKKHGKTDFLGKTQFKTERNGGYQKKSMIHGHDLSSLEGNNWLTSDVINEYSDLIMNNIEDIFIFSTFFLTSLKNRGIENTEGWTRNVNI